MALSGIKYGGTVPYQGSKDVAADTEVPVCRAFVNKTSAVISGAVVTMADGSTVTMDIQRGVIYPMAITEADTADIVFLY